MTESPCRNCFDEDCENCDVPSGQRDGAIIKGGGVSKPNWMSNERYQEYRRTPEYAHETSSPDYSQFEPPEDDF